MSKGGAILEALGIPRAMHTPEAAGERRHVIVMFCDLVDSTGIAAKLDAEEWRDLVGAYLGTASVAVAEMGGKVAEKLGDGVMALFGYPVAQENDAERAVRAALSIQRALAELNRKNQGTGKPALSARIAIESRPVVVDVSGEISVTRRISRRRHSPTRVRSWPRRHSLRGLVLSHREHGAGERAVGLSQLIQYREVIGIDDRYQDVTCRISRFSEQAPAPHSAKRVQESAW
jgi:Adenylate and Guanylate cyclase catalytic domain